MQLNGPQMILLQQSILNVFPTGDDLYLALLPLNKIFTHLAARDKAYPFQILDVILAAQKDSWLPKLIQRIRDANPADADLQALDASLGPLLTALPADPYQACYLWGATPFADRAQFRSGLQAMEYGQRVVLVINGGPKSGKSHSYQFIAFLAEKLAGRRSVLVDMTDQIAPSRNPEDLAQVILSAIDPALAIGSKPETGWELGHLCRQIAAHIRNFGEPLWVAIDGLSQVNTPEPTKQMVQWMMKEAEKGSIPNLRLILMGYTEPLIGGHRVEEQQLTSLGQDDVAHLLEQAVAVRGITVNDTAMKQEADAILGQLQANADQGLSPLHNALLAALDNLSAPGGTP